MFNQDSYRQAFALACGLHILLTICLFIESFTTSSTHQQPVNFKQDALTQNVPLSAVSVNQEEIMHEVDDLKKEREKAINAENEKQKRLLKQATQARQARLEEEQRLAKLKTQAETLAKEQQKQMAIEAQKLKQIAEQKAKEAQQLATLKREQEELKKSKAAEALKLAKLKKNQQEEKLKLEKKAAEARKREEEAQRKAKEVAQVKANQLKAEQEQKRKLKALELAKKEAEEKRKVAAEAAAKAQQAKDEAKNAALLSEVNKYKVLIINAIGRQWILPDHPVGGLSSQFRIRLGSDGTVLAVTLIRSSGDAVLDHSAQTAIYKASPLPVPSSPETFNIFRDISLTVRPENISG